MPTAQVIQLDHHRQSPPAQLPISKIAQVRQLLKEATSAPPNPEIIETRLSAMESQLTDVLNILRSEGGQK